MCRRVALAVRVKISGPGTFTPMEIAPMPDRPSSRPVRKPPMQNRAYAYLLLTMLFWGGNSVAGKLAVGHVSPMILVTLRWVLALAVLGALGWRQLIADWPAMRRHLPMLCALAVCGFTFFNALFYTALAYTTAINVSIEQAGMPVLIILINFLLFRISVTWLQLVGVLATIAGVAITACHGDPRQLLALGVNVGDGMMLIAVVLYSGYTVFLRFKPNIHWKSLMLALAFFSFVTALPFLREDHALGLVHARRRPGELVHLLGRQRREQRRRRELALERLLVTTPHPPLPRSSRNANDGHAVTARRAWASSAGGMSRPSTIG